MPARDIDEIVAAARDTRRSACLDERHCWRIVPGSLAVEETTDGGASWRMAWSLSGPKLERYRLALAENIRQVPTYPADDLDRELTCTDVTIVPASNGVIVACGLAGFVNRDSAGQWRMLGFDGQGIDISTELDNFQQFLIVLCGFLILVVGAEVHALRYRGGSHSGLRQALALIVAFLCLLCLFGGGGDLSFFLIWFALMYLAVVGVVMLAWAGVYLGGRRTFPWWTIPTAVVGPLVAGSIHFLMLRGYIYARPAWIAIWSVLAAALAVTIGLALLIRGPARAASQ